jgi:hypothetical protein
VKQAARITGGHDAAAVLDGLAEREGKCRDRAHARESLAAPAASLRPSGSDLLV